MLALTSCETPPPQIVSSTNPVTGNTSVGVQRNYVAHTGGPAEVAEVQVNPIKLTISSGPQYALQIIYVANKWLFIGNDIPFNVDGHLRHLQATSGLSNRNVNPDSTVVETIVCLVDRDDLKEIAGASKVIAQLAGRNGSMFLTLSPANIAVFQQFLAR